MKNKSMSKSTTMSFSVPLELSIQMEEYIETEKISRSELIKNALEEYLELKESNKNSNKLINEMYLIVKELRGILKKEN